MWPASSQCGSLQQWPGPHLPQPRTLQPQACCSSQKRAQLREVCSHASSTPDQQEPHLSGPSSKQPQQQQPNDPRLKWARPEWIKQPQQQAPKPKQAQQAGVSGTNTYTPATVYKKRQRLLNKVTYGSYSSTESDDDNASRHAQVVPPQQLLFQALAVDFGAQRIGIAVRHSSHNVPLLTLHRQQYHLQQRHSSSSSSSSNGDTGDSSMVPLKRTAAAVLHLALQQGCDGFVMGLPLYTDQQQPDRPSGLSAAAAAGGADDSNGRWINNVIRTFAAALAELAAPLELPVLLVNEQQSSQQARAVMSGAAAYDIKTLAEIAAEEQAAAVLGEQQRSGQQQQQQQQRIKQQQAIGRDAYAAALILSRYYNGLVTPLEQVQPASNNSSSGGGGGADDGRNDNEGSSGNSSSNNSRSWSWSSKRVQQQAATDFKYMQIPPAEQRRRQEQRGRMKAAAAAEADSASEAAAALAGAHTLNASEQAEATA